MVYVTSRGFKLPVDAGEMRDAGWFNMWTRRLWPYDVLECGDTLYWYESPRRRILWKSRVSKVDRFPYQSKTEAANRLRDFFDGLDEQQRYFVDAPRSGFCLAYRVDALELVDLERPEGFRFNQTGWMRIEDFDSSWPDVSALAR